MRHSLEFRVPLPAKFSVAPTRMRGENHALSISKVPMPGLPLSPAGRAIAGSHPLLRRVSQQTEAKTVPQVRAYLSEDWCPRLISPPICRVYDFIDDRHRFMDCFVREAWEARPKKCISPERRRYEAKTVVELGLSAKEFFERCGITASAMSSRTWNSTAAKS